MSEQIQINLQQRADGLYDRIKKSKDNQREFIVDEIMDLIIDADRAKEYLPPIGDDELIKRINGTWEVNKNDS